ncbi:MAG: GrpB family protein [Steroidobacteraceae bacterium]
MKARHEIVSVVDYDVAWPAAFTQLSGRIWKAVEDVALSIEHVGSTAVPGLAAKPVIDMDIVVRSTSATPTVIERLAALGYVHRGNLGIEGREAFERPPGSPAHHLYACVSGSVALRNHLHVRDWLRAHPHMAAEYGALKKELAARFRDDIDGYAAGKTAFLLEVSRAAGFPPDELAAIAAANQSGQRASR